MLQCPHTANRAGSGRSPNWGAIAGGGGCGGGRRDPVHLRVQVRCLDRAATVCRACSSCPSSAASSSRVLETLDSENHPDRGCPDPDFRPPQAALAGHRLNRTAEAWAEERQLTKRSPGESPRVRFDLSVAHPAAAPIPPEARGVPSFIRNRGRLGANRDKNGRAASRTSSTLGASLTGLEQQTPQPPRAPAGALSRP